jgi:hypothetical protein
VAGNARVNCSHEPHHAVAPIAKTGSKIFSNRAGRFRDKGAAVGPITTVVVAR